MIVEKHLRSFYNIRPKSIGSGHIQIKWKTPRCLEFFAEYSDILFVKDEENSQLEEKIKIRLVERIVSTPIAIIFFINDQILTS